MPNRKWITNIAALFLITALLFSLSGFYVDTCSVTIGGTSYKGIANLEIPDEPTENFKAIYNSADPSSSVIVYVKSGATVEIPFTVYMNYENYTGNIDDAFIGKHSVSVGDTDYPCTLGTLDGNQMITSTFTIPHTAISGTPDTTVTITGEYNEGTSPATIFSKDITIKCADTIICPSCNESIALDGTITHTSCKGCNKPCVDGVCSHEACSVCNGNCSGNGIVHNACDVCGAICNGTAITHNACSICGAICNGTAINHKNHSTQAEPTTTEPTTTAADDTDSDSLIANTADISEIALSTSVMLASFSAIAYISSKLKKID